MKNEKKKNITLSEQFQKPTEYCKKKKEEAKLITLTHVSMTTHFPGLVQALQQKVVGQK